MIKGWLTQLDLRQFGHIVQGPMLVDFYRDRTCIDALEQFLIRVARDCRAGS
jgi:hypothetical protein